MASQQSIAASTFGRRINGACCMNSHFIAFSRNAGRGPGRAVAEGYFAGIGEARFERWACLAVDDGYLVSGFGQLIGGGDADDSGPKNYNFHDTLTGKTGHRIVGDKRLPYPSGS